MKPIIPSLREKNRYVAFKVKCGEGERLSHGEVKKALLESCMKVMGMLNMARANVMVMHMWKDNIGIVKVNNQYLNELHASLLFMQNVNGKKVEVESLYVSGVLNKAEPFLERGSRKNGKEFFFGKENLVKEKENMRVV